MKRIIAFAFTLLYVLLCNAREDMSRDTLTFDPQHFRIDVDYMYLRRWSDRSLDYGYSLELRNDSVICHLPYMGVAYQADFDTDGLNFEKPVTQYSINRLACLHIGGRLIEVIGTVEFHAQIIKKPVCPDLSVAPAGHISRGAMLYLHFFGSPVCLSVL